MSPDRPSIEERLAAIEQQQRGTQSMRGSVVARTEDPFTWKQMGTFFACLIAAVALAWGGWHYFSVSRAIGNLKNSDSKVRQQSAEELGKLKSPRSLQPLLDAMRNDAPQDYASAQAEAEAVGSLGTAALQPLLADLRDETLSSSASDGLVKVGAPAVDPLLADLGDSDSSVRWSAELALGGIGDSRAVDPLIARLSDKKSNVRQQAAESLGEIKDARADQPLIVALKDEDDGVRRAAGEALGAIGDPTAVNFLLAALHNQESDTVAAAVDFYIRRGDAGSEDALIAALDKAQDEHMAEALLNSGNDKLHKAAEDWASRNNYEINYLPGGGATAWGGKQK